MPLFKRRDKRAKQARAGYKAVSGHAMNSEMAAFTDALMENADGMYEAGRFMKSMGLEPLDISEFMEECGLRHEDGSVVPFEVHMSVVQVLYAVYQDGYRGVER